MNEVFWLTCAVVLALLACLDFSLLWRLDPNQPSKAAEGIGRWISPFTVAAQGVFAVFAALGSAHRAIPEFSLAASIRWGELVFVVLMVAGAVAAWRRNRPPVR